MESNFQVTSYFCFKDVSPVSNSCPESDGAKWEDLGFAQPAPLQEAVCSTWSQTVYCYLCAGDVGMAQCQLGLSFAITAHAASARVLVVPHLPHLWPCHGDPGCVFSASLSAYVYSGNSGPASPIRLRPQACVAV